MLWIVDYKCTYTNTKSLWMEWLQVSIFMLYLAKYCPIERNFLYNQIYLTKKRVKLQILIVLFWIRMASSELEKVQGRLGGDTTVLYKEEGLVLYLEHLEKIVHWPPTNQWTTTLQPYSLF